MRAGAETAQAQGEHLNGRLDSRFYVLEENISEMKGFELESRAPRGKEDKRRARLPKPTELSLKTLGEDRVSYRDFSEDLGCYRNMRKRLYPARAWHVSYFI